MKISVRITIENLVLGQNWKPSLVIRLFDENKQELGGGALPLEDLKLELQMLEDK